MKHACAAVVADWIWVIRMEQNLFLALLFLNLVTTGILISRKHEGRGGHKMGRTLPTSTMLIQEFEAAWEPYARALRKEDRDTLAELFAMVRYQSAAIASSSRQDFFQVFALAMLGGIMKRVMHLEAIVERESIDLPVEQYVADGDPSEGDWQDADSWRGDPDTYES